MSSSIDIREKISHLEEENPGAMPPASKLSYESMKQQSLATLELALQVALFREAFEKTLMELTGKNAEKSYKIRTTEF